MVIPIIVGGITTAVATLSWAVATPFLALYDHANPKVRLYPKRLTPAEERALLERYTEQQIRAMCVAAELDSSGDKETLLDRLQQAVRDEEAEEEAEEAAMQQRREREEPRAAAV